MADDEDKLKIMSILRQYADRNFVKRIAEPDKYPKLELDKDNYATHKMSYSQVGDSFIVYPKVIHDEKTNTLKELPHNEAIDHAFQNNEFIHFDKEDEADWFSKNYKKVWDK